MADTRSQSWRVLVPGGGEAAAERLVGLLQGESFETVAAPDTAAALQLLQRGEADLMLLSTEAAGPEVLEVLRQARALGRPLPLVLAPEDAAAREQAPVLQAVLDGSGEAIIVADARGRLVYCSATAERLLGFRPSQAGALECPAGHDVRLADGVTPCPPDELPLARALRGEAMNGADLLLRHSESGTTVWLRATARPLHGADGTLYGAVAAFHDVTERKLLQEQYLQAQKMEAVGRLAGGVAHDFNNLLTVIGGYGELLQAGLAAADPARSLVAEIRKAAERGAALTGQLLAVSRRRSPEPGPLDLNVLVREAAAMFTRLIGETIELSTELGPSLGQVRADPGQLEQILLNLVVNARDAMPHGGRLRIGTADVTLDEAAARTRPGLRPGRHVLLSVSDTGTGMTDEVKRRLFEPFFTTKGPGKGTGLGLATVHGIVRQSGGHIEADSTLGRGTTFTLYLPCCAEQGAHEAFRPPVRAGLRGTETVLLVEDEEAVRGLCRRVLQGHGYTVLAAADAPEALGLCASHRGPIHLLVTDVVLPHVGGRALAEHLREVYLEMGVLYLSGYPEHAPESGPAAAEGVAHLGKPFTPADLARRVREMLDRPKAGVRG